MCFCLDYVECYCLVLSIVEKELLPQLQVSWSSHFWFFTPKSLGTQCQYRYWYIFQWCLVRITFQKKQCFQKWNSRTSTPKTWLLRPEDINLGSRNDQLWDSPKHPGDRLKTGLELGYGRTISTFRDTSLIYLTPLFHLIQLSLIFFNLYFAKKVFDNLRFFSGSETLFFLKSLASKLDGTATNGTNSRWCGKLATKRWTKRNRGPCEAVAFLHVDDTQGKAQGYPSNQEG